MAIHDKTLEKTLQHFREKFAMNVESVLKRTANWKITLKVFMKKLENILVIFAKYFSPLLPMWKCISRVFMKKQKIKSASIATRHLQPASDSKFIQIRFMKRKGRMVVTYAQKFLVLQIWFRYIKMWNMRRTRHIMNVRIVGNHFLSNRHYKIISNLFMEI